MASINETITMLEAIVRVKEPETTLRDLFFGRTRTFPTEHVELDYKKGGLKLAPYVVDNFGRGVNVARDGYKRTTYTPPMTAPQRPLALRDLKHLLMGETIYSTKTPEQRAAAIRMEDLAELRGMNVRSEEKMVADFLLYRQFSVRQYVDDVLSGVEETVVFEGDGKETLTGNATWDNEDADILGDFRRAKQFVLASAPAASAIVAVCSPNVVDYLLHNASLQKILDNRNLSVGNFKPRITGKPGLEYVGTLFDTEIYSYYAQYEDYDKEVKPFLPDDYFILGVTGRGRRLYGAITQLEPNGWHTYEGMYVPKYWKDLGGDVEMLRMASRQVIAPEDGNDYYTIKVK
jgi:hypothetical protein